MSIMLTRPDQIAGARLATLVRGLKLECQGLSLRKGRASCYATLKAELHIKGNKEKVLAIAQDRLDKVKAEIAAENARLQG